ncbi:MAG: transcriptional repressor LexA [Thermomicrobium sp.]|nr:transcriptional repressor LexA [Thermomicrobium sp.]MCS7246302.1 transcriptional repressor LexA [Thermomicrobium sp.]MDW7982243.1 transcriptional repressor LexA [Thermomicrobium sp.]
MGKRLTKRQQDILAFIRSFIDEHGYPPTVREIQAGLGISSTSVVDYNLNVLEYLRLIRRNRNISRGIELLERRRARHDSVIRVPLVGTIAAGQPLPVLEPVDAESATDFVELGATLVAHDPQDLFALRVRGRSMIDALIDDGDIVILRRQSTATNGETVAAWLKREEETTLKRFYREGDVVRLQPANTAMQPIFTTIDNVEIQGKLLLVIRRLE